MTEHSKKFEKIKKYYDSGVWTKAMVHDAVTKGLITPEEYQEITGDPYDADQIPVD